MTAMMANPRSAAIVVRFGIDDYRSGKDSCLLNTSVTRLTVPFLFSFQHHAVTKMNPAAAMTVLGRGFLILAMTLLWLVMIRQTVSLAPLWKPTAQRTRPAAAPMSAISAQESVPPSVED